jgi:3D (Asp-Asp-Asp) domain-containing protein
VAVLVGLVFLVPATAQAATVLPVARVAGQVAAVVQAALAVVSRQVNALRVESASASRCQKAPPSVPENPITHREWLTGWVNAAGRPTVPVCLGKWSDGPPAWLKGGWRNASGAVTYPLAGGGWADGVGVRTLGYGGVTFAPGSSLPLRYYHSIAVDPRLIPLGSRVYVPAYRHIGGGWFTAQDTGGAIKGRHIDVYRPAPASPADLGRYMTDQRILVIPPS